MIRNLFPIAVMAFMGFVGILINACQKDDNTPPAITINGPNPVYVSLDSQYIDKGASVTDNRSSGLDVNSNLSHSNPNVKHTGVYEIIYYATDNAGNKGTAVRTVIVKNDAAFLANNYIVSDTAGGVAYYYLQTITADTAINYRIHFSNFGNYNNNRNIYATVKVKGDTVSLPLQTANNIGLTIENHSFKGTAVVTGQNFVLNYTDKNLTLNDSTAGVAHYLKQ